MELDEIDIRILKENFCDDIINQIDLENVRKINDYLNENKVYYAKDLLLTSLDLFLLSFDEFVERFENLKKKLGDNFVVLLGEDLSLIELMY